MFPLKPEIIIIIAIAVIGLYILIRSSISSQKLNKKDSKKANDGKLELKTVVTPSIDEKELKRQVMLEEESSMQEAALESIEDEKNWKTTLLREEKIILDAEKEKEKSQLDKKLAEMRKKLDEIEFSEEEQTFVNEVEHLSPELKAILFADILNKHGID